MLQVYYFFVKSNKFSFLIDLLITNYRMILICVQCGR